MPHGDTHKIQKTKNWIMFGLLVGFVVLMVAITILKVSGWENAAS